MLVLGSGESRSPSENPLRRYQKNARKHRQQNRVNKNSFEGENGVGELTEHDQYDLSDEYNTPQPNMYAYTPPNHEPSYEEEDYFEEHQEHLEPQDVLDQYTSTVSSKLLVGVSASLFSAMLFSVLSLMLTSRWSPVVTLPISLMFFFSTFRKASDLGQLARAFGVINILLMRRANISKSLADLFLYVRAAVNLAKRNPYPPSENPWSHRFLPDDPNSIQFSMYSTILAVMLLASSVGSNIAKPIPLFPNWIGALIGAGFCSYFCTLRDGRGDLLRFIGNSVVNCWSAFSEAAEEVDLWSKLNKVSGKSMGQLRY